MHEIYPGSFVRGRRSLKIIESVSHSSVLYMSKANLLLLFIDPTNRNLLLLADELFGLKRRHAASA